MKLLIVIMLAAVLSNGSVSRAHDLDAASSDGLAKTQELLTSPAAREAAIANSPGGQIADGQVKALAGNSGNTEDIYKISTEIFSGLVNETGGDPAKMQALMERAKNDPKGFADHLNAKDRKAIEDMSHKISGAPSMRQPAAAQ